MLGANFNGCKLPPASCQLTKWWAVLDFLRYAQDKLTLATVFAPPLTLPNKAASRFDLWWAVLDFLRFTQDKLTPATVFAPPLTRPNTAALRLVNWWAVLDSNQRLSA